jgi:hypothetical protein
MSAPRKASRKDATARTSVSPVADSSSARAAAFVGSRPAMRICRIGRTRRTASAWDRAWTPVPRMARTAASSRANRRADSAEHAAVRAAVMAVPSSTAAGRPVSGSNATITAWWVGRSVPALRGKTDTSLLINIPAEGT